MNKGRLEAFSDGVFAIIITIMVLDLHVPLQPSWEGLRAIYPVFLSYLLSYIYVGIYWNNHHHLLHAAERISGGVLWANLHLLFWLSLAPFTTAWLGAHPGAPAPTAAYGVMLLFAAVAYWLLTRELLKQHGQDSHLARSIGADRKGVTSVIVYLVSVCIAPRFPVVSCAGYVAVALMWLVPDSRIEHHQTTSA